MKSLCEHIDKEVLKILFTEFENKINENIEVESYTVGKVAEIKVNII